MSILNSFRRIWLESQIRRTGDEVVKAIRSGEARKTEWLLERLEKLHEERRSTL